MLMCDHHHHHHQFIKKHKQYNKQVLKCDENNVLHSLH